MVVKKSLSILLLCLFSSVLNAKNIIVGVEDIEYYPLWAQRSGKYAGFARELFDDFAAKHGHTIEYKPLPIKRLYSELLHGRVDLKFPDSPYWANDVKQGYSVVYSDPTLDYIDGVMALANSTNAIATLGTVRGFTPWDYLDQIEQGQIKVVENSDLDGLFKLIQAGRVDGGYFNVLVARYYLKHTLFQDNTFVFNQNLAHSKGQYHVSTIHQQDVVNQFNRYLQENADAIAALKKKYEIDLLE